MLKLKKNKQKSDIKIHDVAVKYNKTSKALEKQSLMTGGLFPSELLSGLFNQHNGICWLQSAIVGLFLSDKGQQYLWPRLFYFKEGVKYPVSLKTFKYNSKLNKYCILFEIIRHQIEIAYGHINSVSSQESEENSLLLTAPKLERQLSVNRCTIATSDLFYGINRTFTPKERKSPKFGSPYNVYLVLQKSFREEIYNINEYDMPSKRYLLASAKKINNKDVYLKGNFNEYDILHISLKFMKKRIGHSISIFKHNNVAYLFDNDNKKKSMFTKIENININNRLEIFTFIKNHYTHKKKKNFQIIFRFSILFNNIETEKIYENIDINDTQFKIFYNSLSYGGKIHMHLLYNKLGPNLNRYFNLQNQNGHNMFPIECSLRNLIIINTCRYHYEVGVLNIKYDMFIKTGLAHLSIRSNTLSYRPIPLEQIINTFDKSFIIKYFDSKLSFNILLYIFINSHDNKKEIMKKNGIPKRIYDLLENEFNKKFKKSEYHDKKFYFKEPPPKPKKRKSPTSSEDEGNKSNMPINKK
jgi:hypothetical protein